MNILLLLIGGNPIANYALIKYFKKNGNTLIPPFDSVALLYTNGTKILAENIKQLEKSVNFIDIDLADNDRDLNMVKKIVTASLEQYSDIKSIHLNYTGGTKPMSIGAFLAVTEMKNIDEKNKIYSDISPKNYKLTLKRGIIYPQKGSLSDYVCITIDEFYLLNKHHKPKYKTEHSEFYSETFCQFLLEKSLNEEKDFYEELWDKEKAYSLNWKASLKDGFIDKECYNSKKSFKKLQDFVRGKWLEEYLFALLNEIRDEVKLTDIAWNIEKNNHEFEIDVLVTKGYRLYTFSCTTDDKKAIVKQKAFEVNLRAEQIGGIGATPVLVSFADKKTVEDINETMQFYVGKKSFDSIGIEEIQDKMRLKQKLREIFQ